MPPAHDDAALTLPVPGATNSLGANKAIVIDAVIRATLSTALVYSRTSTTIRLTFSSPVTGVTVNSFRLFYRNRSVSLAGAVVRGSGTSWQLILPRTATSLRGNYRLDVGGPRSGITSGGVPMTTVSSLSWTR